MFNAPTEVNPFDVLIPDPRELGETQATLEQKCLDSLTDDLLARLDGRWVWSYRTFPELRNRWPIHLKRYRLLTVKLEGGR